jgi:CRISPR-associated protein Csb2
VICASDDVLAVGRASYVVTNATNAKPTHQAHPGRVAQQKERAGVVPSVDSFAFTWPSAPDPQKLDVLQGMARRVPHLGRSDSPAEIAFIDGEPEQHPLWTYWEPAELGDLGTIQIGTPYPGYVDALEHAYADGRRSWEVQRTTAYRKRGAPTAAGAASTDSPYPAENVFVFGFDRGRVPYRGEVWMKITDVLRRAVIDQVADPVPAQVSGHGADGQLHAAYLGLLDAGGQYSDGHLLGVAVGLPATLSQPDMVATLRGLIGIKTLTIDGQRIGVEYDQLRRKPWGLTVERWTGGRAGARRWVTATPLSFNDRFLRSKSVEWAERRLAARLVEAGYPEPSDVMLSRTPLLPGAPYRPMWMPPKRDGFPIMHATVTFPAPVRGLVIAGATRYLGGGLFCPILRDVVSR